MNYSQVAEMACLLTHHSAEIIESPLLISERALCDYWEATRQQLFHWMEQLDDWDINTADIIPTEAEQETIQPLLEEILLTEMLTRVWVTLLVATDQRNSVDYAESIARGAFLTHMQARHRALSYLIERNTLSTARFFTINRLRKLCERWTDMLLGEVIGKYCIEEYSYDVQRAHDFSQTPTESIATPLIQAGVKLAFSKPQFTHQQVSPQTQKVVSSILAALSVDLFTEDGTWRPRAHVRIRRTGYHDSLAVRKTFTKHVGRTDVPQTIPPPKFPPTGPRFGNF